MSDENKITTLKHNLEELGIPILKLQGILIAKPTMQYISSDRVVMHLLVATRDLYLSSQKNMTNLFENSEMQPANHVMILTDQCDDPNMYAMLKRRSKVNMECMNVPYPIKDRMGNLFTINRLLVSNIEIVSEKYKK